MTDESVDSWTAGRVTVGLVCVWIGASLATRVTTPGAPRLTTIVVGVGTAGLAAAFVPAVRDAWRATDPDRSYWRGAAGLGTSSAVVGLYDRLHPVGGSPLDGYAQLVATASYLLLFGLGGVALWRRRADD